MTVQHYILNGVSIYIERLDSNWREVMHPFSITDYPKNVSHGGLQFTFVVLRLMGYPI